VHSWDDRCIHHVQFFIGWDGGTLSNFCPGWPQTVILLISMWAIVPGPNYFLSVLLK
jgi:hypothetical protein